MKKLLYFLLFANFSIAQRPNFNAQFKLDSLRTIINKNQKEDSTKIYQLSDLGRLCFHEGLYLEGLLATQKVLILSKKINFLKGEGIYLKTLNELQENGLKPYYYASKWFFTDNKLTYIPSKLQLRRYKNLHIDSVFIELKKAAIYFEKNRDEQILGNIYLQISNRYLTMNNWQQCINYSEKALLIFKNKINESISVYSALIYKMYALEKINKIKEAKATEIEANIMVSKSTDKREIAVLSEFMAEKYKSQKRLALAIEYFSKADKAFEDINEKESRINILAELANIYGGLGINKKSAEYYLKEIKLCEETNNLNDIGNAYFQLGFRFIDLKNFEIGRKYIQKGYQILIKGSPFQQNSAMAKAYDADGQILMAKGKYKEAIPLFELSVQNYHKNRGMDFSYYIDYYLSNCYQKLGFYQKSIEFGLKSYNALGSDKTFLQNLSFILSENYQKIGNTKLAYKYLKEHTDIIAEKEKIDLRNSLADLEIREVVKKTELEKEAIKLKAKSRSDFLKKLIVYFALALFSALFILYFLNKNFKNKKKANSLLENTLTQLKATQTQLIQSEKLASLGELTAGIAHEIQNPLNFVNNFSEVSNELLAELKGPLTPEGGILAGQKIDMDIISDLESNIEKISLHGKRASSIVKGMLEHSRTSTGEKELTDINALADEYLRLAYHGLRAKDKNFNADFKTELDPNLPKIMVIPQDIGRVLLNLINNAFQATPADASDRPNEGSRLVVVKTLLVPEMYSPIGGRGAIISVSDNGSGMSPEIQAKIFQPFFTTKPTGQGTGLGLSLAYDIITKGHGGTIECLSEEGVGTEFIVKLPIV